ncbi:ABC transporter permease [Mesorhizobium sp. LSHC426A00]|uniref:ABC transporter permease n=2 Tax=unclassified Mesorhizobium TaxID=325217 RepID=UPI0003CEBBED|nr:ABC transporter permease [Mesorhizobium sp. LSHC426A00]ESX46011.1 ABC transporter permease [Mesorhizobium sp. LSHC426A00]
MLRFLAMRIASAVPVMVILSLVTFAIIQAPPGDYADYIRSQLINQGGASFAEADAQAQAYRVEHGLDKPLPVQYLNWVAGIITRGDFGYSLYYNKPVAAVVGERLPRTLLLALVCHLLASVLAAVVGERLPRTLLLALVCHLLASVLGITFGIWAATRQYTWIDSVLSAISFLGMTVPRFLMALIIVYLLVFQFNVSEIGSFFSPQYGGAPWSWAKFADLVKHVWPVVAIATFGGLAYNMRVMRGNLLDTLNAQYVETAKAKGLTGSAVVMRHAVPNALHPLIMYQGVVLPYMLTGEIETAIIFALPTVGPAIVGSMAVGDVYVTATFMMVLSATLIVGNIIADMLLALLDPRVRQFRES